MRLLAEILAIVPRHLMQLVVGQKIRNLTDEQFITLLKDGHSLYRWGDGETAISRGKSISYQASNEVLRNKLNALLNSKDVRTINGLSWAVSTSLFDKRWRSKKLFKVMFSTRVYLLGNHKFNADSNYVETQVWYHRRDIRNDLNHIVGKRPCLVIANTEEFLNAAPAHAEFLQCQSKNAFESYHRLAGSISEWIAENYDELRPCILVACGPTSKAIVLDFRNRCQVIDVGHGFNFYLHGYGSYAWKTG